MNVPAWAGARTPSEGMKSSSGDAVTRIVTGSFFLGDPRFPGAETHPTAGLPHRLGLGYPAQLRAGPSTVVRRNSGDTRGHGVWLEQLPDDLLAQRSRLGLVASVHGTEHRAIANAGGSRPRIDRHLDPRWHRDCPHAAML